MIKTCLQNFLFKRFEKCAWSAVRQDFDWITDWANTAFAENKVDKPVLSTTDQVVATGRELRAAVLNQYNGAFQEWHDARFLIHVPPPELSPAGFSFFSNLIASLSFLGLNVRPLMWNDRIEDALEQFFPTVFLTSDADSYLSRVDWQTVAQFKRKSSLLIGLTASLEEHGNTPLQLRLDWARNHGVDFYYAFRAPEYIQQRPAYMPFFTEGYQVLSIEFGANPLIHFPVSGPPTKADFVFLGSTNYDKRERYQAFFGPILRRTNGFIAGPGWSFCQDYLFEPARDRHTYACGKIGLNLSIQEQLEWPCELNERTYILAACGIPQLIDNPALLPMRFSDKALFSASTAKEYEDTFFYMLQNSDICRERTLQALHEVFSQHTTFHRLEKFLQSLRLQFPSIGGADGSLRKGATL